MDRTTFTRYDIASQATTSTFWHDDVDEGNLQNLSGRLDTLRSALDNITRAQTAKIQIAVASNFPAATRAGSRELKWLLRLRDNVTSAVFPIEVGTASETAPIITTVDGRKLLNPASTAFTQLANAISQVAKSPYGNGVTLISAEMVGRNI